MTSICVLSVEGMHCQGCVARVERALRQLSGVNEVTVSLETNLARVTFDSSRIQAVDLAQTVEDAGYRASIARDDAASGR